MSEVFIKIANLCLSLQKTLVLLLNHPEQMAFCCSLNNRPGKRATFTQIGGSTDFSQTFTFERQQKSE